jgi:hypothetical protein
MANSEEGWIKDLGPVLTEQCKLIGIDHIPTTKTTRRPNASAD